MYDQTAYVRGSRHTGESIRLVSDILDFTEENSIGGILFSADFEKAFDTIEYPFLLAVLKSFGFSPQFIHWVRKIFKNAESCVMNNGHSTGYFPRERGTRQGDPLSAYLFIPCAETLFIQIRENEEVKGIRVGDNEIKLSAYADFLASDVSSLKTIFQACATFQLYSSLKLNLEKSEACWIGNSMGSDEGHINGRCRAIHTLGIFNSYDKDFEQKMNFLDNIDPISVIYWGGGGGHKGPHHKFVVTVPMIMKFGTGIKLDVFYTMVTLIVRTFQLSPPKRLNTVVKNIKGSSHVK